jgi:hypothetical protein
VDITPAARWFYSESDREHWDVREDFPVVVPPWGRCWLEYVSPRQVRSGDATITLPAKELRVGAALSSGIVPEDKRDKWKEFEPLYEFLDEERTVIRERQMEAAAALGCELTWVVIAKLFFGSDHELRQGPAISFYLDQRGQVMPEFAGLVAYNVAEASLVPGHLFPFLFALSLMHCKNVAVEPIEVPAKVTRARAKRQLPPVRYHTIVIEPMRRRTLAEPGPRGSDAKRAMHIVRGHFKDYREAGLFGRYHGIYWWDMAVRGDVEAGRVVQQFRVRPPREEDQ